MPLNRRELMTRMTQIGLLAAVVPAEELVKKFTVQLDQTMLAPVPKLRLPVNQEIRVFCAFTKPGQQDPESWIEVGGKTYPLESFDLAITHDPAQFGRPLFPSSPYVPRKVAVRFNIDGPSAGVFDSAIVEPGTLYYRTTDRGASIGWTGAMIKSPVDLTDRPFIADTMIHLTGKLRRDTY